MTAANLTPAWHDALQRLGRRRSSPILMPCAVLVALDMVDEGVAKSGTISFSEFEPRFDEIVGEVDASKKGSGWQPFYHLAGDASLWTLYQGKTPASFADLAKGRPRSRAAFVGRADSARIKDQLLKDLGGSLEGVRSSLLESLSQDANDSAKKLAASYAKRRKG